MGLNKRFIGLALDIYFLGVLFGLIIGYIEIAVANSFSRLLTTATLNYSVFA
jgi:hypothetical protein